MIKIESNKEVKGCWWCGHEPNSQEHRHKKSDVKHIFGNNFEGEPVIIRGNIQKDVQGPNSKLLKFEKVLCQDCNNSRSQPFDRAYDQFIGYTLKNYSKILDKRIIDFNDIVPNDVSNFKNNVLRYFTKAFCCRLATNNITIKPEIIEFLDGKKPLDFLYFKFEIRPDIHAFINRSEADANEGNIYLSPLRSFLSEDKNNLNLVYQFYNLQWLRTYTFYSEKMNEEFYSGYKSYNDSQTIKIEAKYSRDPNNLFDESSDFIMEEQNENNWLEEYLNTNVFKN